MPGWKSLLVKEVIDAHWLKTESSHDTNLSSLVPMATTGATCDDKVGIMTTSSFQFFGARTSAVIIHGDANPPWWCFTEYMAPPLHLCFPGPEGHEINRMIWTHIPINWQFCSWWEIHNSRIMWSVNWVKRWPYLAVYFAHLSAFPPRWTMEQFPPLLLSPFLESSLSTCLNTTFEVDPAELPNTGFGSRVFCLKPAVIVLHTHDIYIYIFFFFWLHFWNCVSLGS